MNRIGRKATPAVIFVILFSLLLAAAAGCRTSAPQPAAKPEVIRVAYSFRPLNIPSIVALNKKLFEEEFAKERHCSPMDGAGRPRHYGSAGCQVHRSCRFPE